jgi:hypothetical protein
LAMEQQFLGSDAALPPSPQALLHSQLQ